MGGGSHLSGPVADVSFGYRGVPEERLLDTPGRGARSAGVQGDRHLPPVPKGERPVQRVPVRQQPLQGQRP